MNKIKETYFHYVFQDSYYTLYNKNIRYFMQITTTFTANNNTIFHYFYYHNVVALHTHRYRNKKAFIIIYDLQVPNTNAIIKIIFKIIVVGNA